MPHIFIRTVVTSVKKKYWFLLGSVLLAGTWLLQNIVIDPHDEDVKKIETRDQELRFYESRLAADEQSDQLLQGFKNNVSDSQYRHDRLINLINHASDVNGLLAAGFLLRYGDDSLLAFQPRYTANAEDIEKWQKNSDTSALITYIKLYASDNDTTTSQSQLIALSKRHSLSESVKFWKFFVPWFVIVGAIFINFDKAREFLKHADDKQIECKYQPPPNPHVKKKKP